MPLHVAAEAGDLDAVSALIEAGDDVNARTQVGVSLLTDTDDVLA